MVGEKVAIGVLGVRLIKDVPAGAQLQRPGVVKTAHARPGAEIVVERAVLLHEDDHMFDVLDPPVSRRRLRQRFCHIGRE